VLAGEADPFPERGLVERTSGGKRAPLRVEGVSVIEDEKLAEKVGEASAADDAKLQAKVDKAAEKVADDADRLEGKPAVKAAPAKAEKADKASEK